MHKLVQKAKLDPTMHRIATWIRSQVPEDYRGSTRATADAVFNWVKRHGLFQRDQFQVERVEHPISSMQSLIAARKNGLNTRGKLFAGDCDQFAIWIAALGGILGFQYAFETSKSDAGRPDEFSHVWASLLVGPNWVAYDASTPQAFPDWRPPISSPDKMQRWPEKEIEGTLSGLGDDMPEQVPFYVPREYFGDNELEDSPPPEVMDNDPGQLHMMVPAEPALPEAEVAGDLPLIDKEPVPPPGERMTLIANSDTGPHYREKPHTRYAIQKRMYPKRSLWNRQRVDTGDRAPLGRPAYFKNQPSTVPTADMTVVSTTPITVVREGARNRVVRRDLRSQVIVRRPQMRPAGVGMGVITDETKATLATDASKAATTAVTQSKSIWDTVADVVKAVAPTAQSAVLAKYAPAVANATNTVAGKQVATPSMYPTKPFWQQAWFLGGLGAIAAGTVAVVVMNKKPSRRRR